MHALLAREQDEAAEIFVEQVGESYDGRVAAMEANALKRAAAKQVARAALRAAAAAPVSARHSKGKLVALPAEFLPVIGGGSSNVDMKSES